MPVVISVHEDRAWSLQVRAPTTSSLIRAALTSSGANRNGQRRLTRGQLREIAQRKLGDLNTHDVDKAMRTIAGTARSMGVTVEPEE